MTTARLMMIRHWHLRNGHKPREGQDYCEGCAHEIDDLIKHMRAAGLKIVAREPTGEMVHQATMTIVRENKGLEFGPWQAWQAMWDAAE